VNRRSGDPNGGCSNAGRTLSGDTRQGALPKPIPQFVALRHPEPGGAPVATVRKSARPRPRMHAGVPGYG